MKGERSLKKPQRLSDKINQSITVIKDNLGLMIDSLSTIRGLTNEQTTLVKNVAETPDTLATIVHQLYDYMKTLG
jgi:hypothetical protein